MSAHRDRRRRGGHGGAHNDERWLLTYSDMITLLMALFIIMWAISTVNDSKFDQLSKSLSDAFSGNIFQGNKAIVEGSSGARAQIVPTRPKDAEQLSESTATQEFDQKLAQTAAQTAAEAAELESLRELKKKIDAYVGSEGLSGKIDTSIDERGLVIRILPDDMLFDTGKADLKPGARPILAKIAEILKGVPTPNPVRVEGNTDNVPISTPEFRNNWELSTERATTVLVFLIEKGFDAKRLSATGYADQRPVTSNGTVRGRALNRRVEIVVVRRAVAEASGAAPPQASGTGGGAVVEDAIGTIITPLGEEVLQP
jgi:chemotaxis protein MotB